MHLQRSSTFIKVTQFLISTLLCLNGIDIQSTIRLIVKALSERQSPPNQISLSEPSRQNLPISDLYSKSDRGDYQSQQRNKIEVFGFEEPPKTTNDIYRSEHPPTPTFAPQNLIPCIFYLSGFCQKGEACPFLHPIPTEGTPHSNEELHAAYTPSAISAPTINASHAPSMKSTPCKFFQSRRCNKGASCPFSHSLIAPSSGQSGRIPSIYFYNSFASIQFYRPFPSHHFGFCDDSR